MTITAREIKWAVGAGMFSALIPLIAVMLMGISPYLTILVILFFPLPLYGAYLSQGPRIGSAASLIGALIGTLIGNMGFLVLYATISLPAHLLCQKAIAKTSSEQTNESQLVQWFTLFILGLCLLGCFIYTSIDSNDLSGILGQVKQQLETLSTGDSRQLETLLPFIPAILSLNVAGLHFVNGALAQGILKRKNLALSPSLSLHQVVISDIWMYALVVAGGLVLLFDGVIEFFAMNCAFVCMLPYWIVGLATIQLYFEKLMPPLNKMILGIYVLIFLIPVAHLIIVCFGLFEPWIRLRSRLGLKPLN